MIAALLPALLPVLGDLFKRWFPDPAEAAKAQTLLEGKEPAVQVGSARYAVQVGAFAEAQKAQEARMTLEKAGFKTYTQVINNADGKRTRVRVGPFTDKAEADKTAEKIKALNLAATVLTL
jgi:DedD protein